MVISVLQGKEQALSGWSDMKLDPNCPPHNTINVKTLYVAKMYCR